MRNIGRGLFPNTYLPKICLFLGLLLFAATLGAFAQSSFQKGKELFRQRAAGADSFRTDPAVINKAIAAFQKAVEENDHPERSAEYLLRSYYFKGMFTGQPKSRQKEIYEKGRRLGEEMMDKYPDSAAIKFWFGANAGRWADVHGFVKAATSGIAKKLRKVCKRIIELNPDYQGGGGYRILAQVHFYSPNIPLLMGWPSNEKALELIEKAMEIAPEHPTNRMLYAEVLLEFDRPQEARTHLEHILQMEPREHYLIEDRYVQHHSRELLNEHF